MRCPDWKLKERTNLLEDFFCSLGVLVNQEPEPFTVDFDDSCGNYRHCSDIPLLVKNAGGFTEKITPVKKDIDVWKFEFRNQFYAALDDIVGEVVRVVFVENDLPRTERKHVGFVFGDEKIWSDEKGPFNAGAKADLIDVGKKVKFTQKKLVKKLNHVDELGKNQEKYEKEKNVHEKDDDVA